MKTPSRKIYVASSWRNEFQQGVVSALREAGHEVYDFKNPKPGDNGFHWSEIDPEWKGWKPEIYLDLLTHPIAESGFKSDWEAMLWADTCVLVLPCGRSAHIEAGYFVGAGKRLIILLHEDKFEPELMYKMSASVCCSMAEVFAALSIQSDARQDLAEQVTKLEAQLEIAKGLLSAKSYPDWSNDRDAFLDSLDQREGKGRKI